MVLCGAAATAAAGPLIRITDLEASASATGSLSDDAANLAVSWTQSVASSNVTLSVVITSNVGPATGAWYVANAIGPGSTAANVVSSGTYSLPGALPPAQFDDFDLAPRVVLGSGLSFAPGTYFLVLDGPAGVFFSNADWAGDAFATSSVAPGFSLGSYFFTDNPAAFAPSGAFAAITEQVLFAFDLDGDTAVIPLPASLPLLAAGLAVFGLLSRKASRQD
jgi:hypothetical protein